MRRLILLAAATAAAGFSAAQAFIKNQTGRPLSFREIQLQFADFRKNNDLGTSKHWKHFKRYEMDMVRHTNGRGEPDGFAAYIKEAIAVADEKLAQRSAADVWFPVGPSMMPANWQGYAENGIGRINCVGFHPTDTNTFYVGVAQGGLWKTTNGGQTYIPLTDHLPVTRISDICLDPSNPNTVYISVCDFEYVGTGLYIDGRKRHTHYGVGVYKSTDGGSTWNATGLTFQLTNGDASLIRKIVVSPDNSSHVLACGVSGMYKSTNGGTTWNKLLDSLFWDMEPDPVHDSVIYAATGWVETSNIGHAAIYKSIDVGNTWTKLNTGIPYQGSVQRIKLAVAPSDPNYIYAMACDDKDGYYGMYRSIDAGATWRFKSTPLNILEWGTGNGPGGQGTYDMALCVSKTDKNFLYTGGVNIWSSSDSGSTYQPCTHWTYNNGMNTIHADVHAIQQQPLSGSFFVSCDGGLYRSKFINPGNWNIPWTTQWENLSSGMQITSFYRLSSSRNTLDKLIAGAQDNSTFYYDGSGWSTIFGGDGMDNYLDPLNNNIVIGSSQYGNFYYSDNGGVWGTVAGTNPNFEASEWVTPIVADYNRPGVLYVGNENLTASFDGGENWGYLPYIESPTVAATEICALAVSPLDTNLLYIARRVRHELNMKAKVFMSTSGGLSYTNITGSLPDSLYITGIEGSPVSVNEAAICFAGFAAGHKVYKRTNGTWSNISFNLPNVPVNCIKYVSGTNQIVAATDLGLYVLNSGATSWTLYSAGLPNVILSDIEINEATGKMYVSTFGRGIWETNLSVLKALQYVGTEELAARSKKYDFRVYPTVGEGIFTIEKSDPQSCRLTVIDVMGRIVVSEPIVQERTIMNLKLSPGAYYLRMTGGSTFAVRRIVVE